MRQLTLRSFQKHVGEWVRECFGDETAYDTTERNWRFLEEALELVQSLGGNAGDAHKLVDYVFSRPAGSPFQEMGGVMTTFNSLAEANHLSIEDAAKTELERVMRPEVMEKIRAKHAAKPHKSPLPGDYKYAKILLAHKVLVMSNGMIATFGIDGQQIPELQGKDTAELRNNILRHSDMDTKWADENGKPVMCKCNCASPCPLGKTGMQGLCQMETLAASGKGVPQFPGVIGEDDVDEEVCHCGMLMKEHKVYSSCTTPVSMGKPPIQEFGD